MKRLALTLAFEYLYRFLIRKKNKDKEVRDEHEPEVLPVNHIDLVEMIKRHEGTGPVVNGRFMMYKDSLGIWTAGFGRNIQERGFSKDEAELMLANDIRTATDELHQFEWFRELDTVRQAVIINMNFNLGLTRLRGFRQMIVAIERGDYAQAAVEMLDSKWRDQVGARAVELAELMRKGGY